MDFKVTWHSPCFIECFLIYLNLCLFITKRSSFLKSHFVSWMQTPVWHIFSSTDCSDCKRRRKKKKSSRALWDVSVNSNTAPSSGGCRCFLPVFLSRIGYSASPLSSCSFPGTVIATPPFPSFPSQPPSASSYLNFFCYFYISFSLLLIVKWLISEKFFFHREGSLAFV